MATLSKKFLAGAGVILGAGTAAFIIGSVRWNRSGEQAVERLLWSGISPEKQLVSFADLDRLPAPVGRYLRRVLREGQPFVRVARFHQKGRLRRDEKTDTWWSFEASQLSAPFAPGFVWDARVRIQPLLRVRVRDGYLDGEGSGQVNLLSLISLADERGGPELNAGALSRYLAETPWYPTALLPEAGVRWSAIDDARALATLSHAETTVSIEFRFNEAGDVTGIYTPDRHRKVGDRYERTPWEGHFWKYKERSGMRIPVKGEVGWHVAGEWQPVWKGKITNIKYDFVD